MAVISGELTIPKMDGIEIRPGVKLIGEPMPMPDSNKLRALANVGGCLCVIELSLKFGGPRHAAK